MTPLEELALVSDDALITLTRIVANEWEFYDARVRTNEDFEKEIRNLVAEFRKLTNDGPHPYDCKCMICV